MVKVLPVPALASSSVMPVGSGPQTSKGCGCGPRWPRRRVVTGRRVSRAPAGRPRARGRRRRTGAARPESRPAPSRRRAVGPSASTMLGRRAARPRTRRCSLGSLSSLSPLKPESQASGRRPARHPARLAIACGLGRRRLAVQRQAARACRGRRARRARAVVLGPPPSDASRRPGPAARSCATAMVPVTCRLAARWSALEGPLREGRASGPAGAPRRSGAGPGCSFE